MKPSATLKWLAVIAILGTGLIHGLEARDAFGDAQYKGVLFVGNCLAAFVAAIGIIRGQKLLGWYLGLFVAAGALLAYIASRTVGLPGLPAEPENWLEPIGVASLACEALFVIVFFAARAGASSPEPGAGGTRLS